MRDLESKNPRTAWRRQALLALLVCASLGLAACGGGGGDSGTESPGPATAAPTPPATAPSDTVAITLRLEVSAPSWPGEAYMRSGNSVVARTEIDTLRDASCQPTGPGTKTCTWNVPRGQTVTIVAGDQQSKLQFSYATVLQRDIDPRGISSQFTSFGAPCASPARGVCVFTADADRTITASFTRVTWTRLNFVGYVNWRATLRAPAVLGFGPAWSAADQQEVWTATTPNLGECPTGAAPVHCYSIVTPIDATIALEALPPVGPVPPSSSGPLEFVGYDGVCQINGANPNCPLTGGVDQIAVMKWEYYTCFGGGASNPRWKDSYTGCSLVRP
jgi:hypothetical protein